MSARRDRSIQELLAHTRWVEALARKLARDPERAEDLAQSALLVALDAAPPTLGSPRAWLARVLRNLVRAEDRREAQRLAVEHEGARGEVLPGVDELIARADAERELVKAVIELGGEDSRVLLLHYFEGMKLEEIARIEGVAQSTLSHRFARAHARLRAKLEGERGKDWLAALVPVFVRAPKPLVEDVLMALARKAALAVGVVALAGIAWMTWMGGGSESAGVDRAVPEEFIVREEPRTEPASTGERTTAAPQAEFETVEESIVTSSVSTATVAPMATLRGRVVGPLGAPAASRVVNILRMPRGPRVQATTEADGRFEKRELEPGRYHVSTTPEKEELDALGLESRVNGIEWLAQTSVVLDAGAEVEVELGAPPRDPIRITGELRSNEPVEAFLQWVPAGDHGYDRARYASTKDGRYEIVLGQRGPHRLSVSVTGRNVRVDELLVVPAGSEWRHDVEVPHGEIVVRVVTKDGNPLQAVAVTLQPQAGVAFIPHMSASGSNPRTDAEGRVRFSPLRSGLWRVCAAQARPKSGPAYAPRSHSVALTEGAPTSEIVIELEPGLLYSGRIVAGDGGEVAGTSVFVFDDQGEPLNPHSNTFADKQGAFDLPGLAPGNYSIIAANGDRWSFAMSITASAEGAAPKLELQLQPASHLMVDAVGLEAHALSIRDEGGREFAGLLDRNLFSGSFSRQWRPEVWNSYLPRGNYHVRAVGLAGVLAQGRAAMLDHEVTEVQLRR